VCGGHSLTKQEPLNNIARTTIETMAVAIAGLQSVFTAAYDEAFAIPTELAAKTALRVQQIVAYETDVASTVDPLAGSYFVEALTDDMEKAIREVMDRVEQLGGMVECLRSGWVQKRIGERAYEWQRKLDSGEQIVVGVNKFAQAGATEDVSVHRVPLALEQQQIDRLRAVRGKRDEAAAARALEKLVVSAKGTDNLMPSIAACVRAYATVGEVTGALRRVFGTYVPAEF
jgi:methylmalonyl-CoA mutase N-terminal domain/subunit